MKENLNFGVWMVPTSWEEVTLKQLTEIEKLQEEEKVDSISVLAVLTKHSRDEVSNLPLQFVDKMVEKLDFLQSAPDVKPSNKIEIDGVEYVVNVKEKLTFGEFVSTQTALDGDKHCYAQLLAILCRKAGEVYDSKFENEVLPERIELFNNASCTKALAVTAFFFSILQILNLPSQQSSMAQACRSLIQENISNLEESGVGSRLRTKWQIRKLRKLDKYIAKTYLT